MIQEFVNKFNEKKLELEQKFRSNEPEEYKTIVKYVIEILADCEPKPDSSLIHEIDDGDYQGNLVYIIPESRYQPETYWAVKVDYGSCSGCDTLEEIKTEPDTELRIKDYVTLALHIIQGLKEI